MWLEVSGVPAHIYVNAAMGLKLIRALETAKKEPWFVVRTIFLFVLAVCFLLLKYLIYCLQDL